MLFLSAIASQSCCCCTTWAGLNGAMSTPAETGDGDDEAAACAGMTEEAANAAREAADQLQTNAQQLLEGVGGIVPPNTPFRVTRGEGSVGFVIRNDPRGNKRAGGAGGAEGKKE